MRVLVLSDIHANRAALEAVLADAHRLGYEVVWCLGDMVGYGPEPNECVEMIRALDPLAVVGNHDWAVVGQMDADDFNREAKNAVQWTRRALKIENLRWLAGLPSQPIVEGAFTLTHGSPRDPVWEYILYPSVAYANIEHFTTPYCLVGHTHVPIMYAVGGDDHEVKMVRLRSGEMLALPETGHTILNPGSVGQPRDR